MHQLADEDQHLVRAVAQTVRRVESTAAALFLIVTALFVGLPLIRGIASGHPLLGLVNAALLGLLGLVMLFIVNLVVLIPVTTFSYARASVALRRRLAVANPIPEIEWSWSNRCPGAMSLGRDGRIWLADRSTGYAPIQFDRRSILRAEVTTRSMIRARRPSWFVTGVAGLIGDDVIATVTPSERPAPLLVRVSHHLILDYLDPDSGVARSTAIPFGQSADAARKMAAAFGIKSNMRSS